MKTICVFCRTDFSSYQIPSGRARCPACGKDFNNNSKKKAALMIFASLCALLSVAVFSFFIISRHKIENIKNNPLHAEIVKTNIVNDDLGNKQIQVLGRIKNQSNYVYGVPNLFLISKDKNDDILDIETVMAPATLLGAGEYVDFEYTLSGTIYGISTITVQLKDME